MGSVVVTALTSGGFANPRNSDTGFPSLQSATASVAEIALDVPEKWISSCVPAGTFFGKRIL